MVTANPVKGKIQYYFEQARDTSADIGCLLLLAAGLQGDDAMADHATIATLLAATNDEATFTNYVRKILPAAVVTVDNTLNRVVLTITGSVPIPITWSAAGGATNNALGAIVFYYDPTPGSSADAALVFLSHSPISATTDGNALVITLGVEGIAVAEPG